MIDAPLGARSATWQHGAPFFRDVDLFTAETWRRILPRTRTPRRAAGAASCWLSDSVLGITEQVLLFRGELFAAGQSLANSSRKMQLADLLAMFGLGPSRPVTA